MQLAGPFSRKRIAAGGAIATGVVVLAAYFWIEHRELTPMERYVPADALAFLEVDSLKDLTDGITSTEAWRGLAPLLGLSSQWREVGSVAWLMGKTGLGPDEGVLLGRAQCAVVVTGVDADAPEAADDTDIHLRPRVALVIETHLSAERAQRLVIQRAPIIGERIFGDGVAQTSQLYNGAELLAIGKTDLDRTLVATSSGSVIVLANGEQPARVCLDAIAGRAPSLAADSGFESAKRLVANDAAVFALVTRAGFGRLAQLAPSVLGRSASSESVEAAVSLLGHLSEQAIDGLYYSAEFVEGEVRERYLWALRRKVAEGIAEALPPAARTVDSIKLIPSDVEEITVINTESEGELPERLLKRLAPRVDVVIAVALRELVITLKKEYGLDRTESIGDAVGSEVTTVDFGDGNPKAMLLRVNDKSRLIGAVSKYLSRKGGRVTTENAGGVEVSRVLGDDSRAAAFVGDFLVLATPEQIARIIAVSNGSPSAAADGRLTKAFAAAPAGAVLISCKLSDDGAGDFLLAISKLLRVTDGSPDILERQQVREVLKGLERPTSFTELRSSGIYTERRSALGNLTRLASLVGGED